MQEVASDIVRPRIGRSRDCGKEDFECKPASDCDEPAEERDQGAVMHFDDSVSEAERRETSVRWLSRDARQI